MADQLPIEPGRARPGDSLKARIWQRMLTIEQHTMLATVFFFAIVLVGVWIGFNEQTRMKAYDDSFVGRSIQRGASIFDSSCSPCHGKRGEGIEGVAPTLNKDTEFNGARLKELGYPGTLRDYLTLTISAGRPARSSPDWPNAMPTWGDDYGGPLRPDQVSDVVNYVMNWGCAYDYKYDAICQGEDKVIASLPTSTPAPPTPTPKPPKPPEAILAGLPAGDAARGADLFSGKQLASDGKIAQCGNCHSVDGSVVVGPSMIHAKTDMPAVYDSFELYVIESIVDPGKFKVKGFESVNMPLVFYNRLTDQELADLLAYIVSVQK